MDNMNISSVDPGTDIIKVFEENGVTTFDFNHLTEEELITAGYRHVKNAVGLEPFFRMVPQIVSVETIKKEAEQSFNKAVADSYKCILDPGKHLANIKGEPEVFIGSALYNDTNKLAGQARFVVNKDELAFTNQVIPKIFDGLAIITSQYFMMQINDKLDTIEHDISDIRTYLNNKQQSELEYSFHAIKSIMRHLEYFKESPDRISDTMIELKGIEKVAGEGIGLYSREILSTMNRCKNTDSVSQVREAISRMHQNLMSYYYAVGIVCTAKIVSIDLRSINNPDELDLYK